MSGREAHCITIVWGELPEDLGNTVLRRGDSRWVFFGRNITQYHALKKSLAVWGDPINAGELINTVASEIRNDFINLDKHLKTHDYALLWQTTDTAEKNPYTSQFFVNCCKYLAFCRILARLHADLLVVLDDWFLSRAMARHARSVGFSVNRVSGNAAASLCPDQLQHAIYRFGQVLRSVRSRLAFVVDLLRQKAGIRSHRKKGTTGDASPRQVDVLMATWAEPDTFSRNKRVRENNWFGVLPGYFDDHGHAVIYLATPLPSLHSYNKVVQNITSARDRVLVLPECLGWKDIGAIVVLSLVRPWRLSGRFVLQEQDLTDFLHEESWRERTKPRQCWAMQFYYVARFLRDEGLKPKVVIYPYENQPWEKALRLGFKRYLPETRIVAYQHTPFAPLWLGAFPSQKDVKAGDIPENLVVLGSLWKALFLQLGYPERCISAGPALRFEHIFQQNDQEVSRAELEMDERAVLVAGSIGYADTLELTIKTIEALRALPEIRVKLKFHPKMGDRDGVLRLVKSALACLGLDSLPPNFEITEEPIKKLLSRVTVVIHNGTSVAQEAMAAGRKVLLVQSDLWLDMDTLAWWPGAQSRARTSEELGNMVVSLLHADSAAPHEVSGGSEPALSEMFAPVNEQTMRCFLTIVNAGN